MGHLRAIRRLIISNRFNSILFVLMNKLAAKLCIFHRSLPVISISKRNIFSDIDVQWYIRLSILRLHDSKIGYSIHLSSVRIWTFPSTMLPVTVNECPATRRPSELIQWTLTGAMENMSVVCVYFHNTVLNIQVNLMSLYHNCCRTQQFIQTSKLRVSGWPWLPWNILSWKR